jgi:transposase
VTTYLRLIRSNCPQALNALDRFHIVAKMNDALDQVHADEARRMKKSRYQPVWRKTRWSILKRKQNLTSRQKFRLPDPLQYNLKTVRAYLHKETFQQTLGIQLHGMGG